MSLAGFELANPATERLQNQALHCTATGIETNRAQHSVQLIKCKVIKGADVIHTHHSMACATDIFVCVCVCVCV
jgi:hypothetical protein